MNNEEILEKAIQKAINNGWNRFNRYTTRVYVGRVFNYDSRIYIYGEPILPCNAITASVRILYTPEEIIFNHDFAQALWGMKKLTKAAANLSDVNTIYLWQLRLQQMVVSKNLIEYLGDYI